MVMEESSKTQHERSQEAKDIKFFQSFILGQGSIYVLGSCNKEKKEGQIVNNGPNYQERQWNPRPLNTKAVQHLLDSTGGGRMIYSHFQEHALTMGVSGKLMDGVQLASYQSNEFPRLVFAADPNGQLLVLNGHHRIDASKKMHGLELQQLSEYKKGLKGFEVTSDNDTPSIIEAREKATELELQLWNDGQWATILIDTGEMITIIQQTLE